MNANEVTQIRNTTYLARHPGIEAEMELLQSKFLFAVELGRLLSLRCFYSDLYPFQIVRPYFGLLRYVSRLKSQPFNIEKER